MSRLFSADLSATYPFAPLPLPPMSRLFFCGFYPQIHPSLDKTHESEYRGSMNRLFLTMSKELFTWFTNTPISILYQSKSRRTFQWSPVIHIKSNTNRIRGIIYSLLLGAPTDCQSCRHRPQCARESSYWLFHPMREESRHPPTHRLSCMAGCLRCKAKPFIPHRIATSWSIYSRLLHGPFACKVTQ